MLRNYLRLGRIEFAGFLIAAMLMGVLCVRGRLLTLSETLPVILIGLLANFSGFVHNDYLDRNIDRQANPLSERPLVQGSISTRGAILAIAISIALILYTTLLFSKDRLASLIIVSVSMLFFALYNTLSKKMPGTDFFFALSTALLCFLGGNLASDSNGGGFAPLLLYLVTTLVFLDFALFNIGATLKDVVSDTSAGAQTTAIFLGVYEQQGTMTISAAFRSLMLTLRLLTVFLSLYGSIKIGGVFSPTIIAAIGIGATYLTCDLTRMTIFDRQEIGKRLMKQDAFGKLLLPLLLLPEIGYAWFVFILLLPILWFFFFNLLLYGRKNRFNKDF